MVMRTPGSGLPARVFTLPLTTAARTSSMVPGVTPNWTAFVPVYRKLLASATIVATPLAGSGATVAGSGGIELTAIVTGAGAVPPRPGRPGDLKVWVAE